MLPITIPEQELFDESSQMFITTKEVQLRLEHSLVSIHKWEKKWKKPFLETFGKENASEISKEEFISYVECMNMTQNINPDIFNLLTQEDINKIQEYMADPMTATTIVNRDTSGNYHKRRVITAELVYCWMFSQQIPKECDKWHFNTLMTLIRVCSIENNPNPKKMSKAETMARHRAANAKARARSKR